MSSLVNALLRIVKFKIYTTNQQKHENHLPKKIYILTA